MIMAEPSNIGVIFSVYKSLRPMKLGRASIKTSATLPLSEVAIQSIEEDLTKILKCKRVMLLNYFKLGGAE